VKIQLPSVVGRSPKAHEVQPPRILFFLFFPLLIPFLFFRVACFLGLPFLMVQYVIFSFLIFPSFFAVLRFGQMSRRSNSAFQRLFFFRLFFFFFVLRWTPQGAPGVLWGSFAHQRFFPAPYPFFFFHFLGPQDPTGSVVSLIKGIKSRFHFVA